MVREREREKERERKRGERERKRVAVYLHHCRYNLVEKVDSQETAINKVLIAWRGYGSIYHAARTFISQMTKMVGTEPVESSNGNTSLLPTYRVRYLLACWILKFSDGLAKY